jgi:DNA-directed RNA polymerase specialized sigma24 family protein
MDTAGEGEAMRALWAYAHFLVPATGGLDADDLMQEARIGIWAASPRTTGEAIVIGRRRMIDACRAWRGRRTSARAAAQHVPLDTVLGRVAPDCADQVIHRLDLEQVAEDLAGLTTRDRDVEPAPLVDLVLADLCGTYIVDGRPRSSGVSGRA